MQRKIKFRVYDKLSKKYIQENSVYIMGALVNGVLTFCADDKNGLLNHHIIEQFTGLYDKNGKEIYEGDIIKSGYSGSQEHIVCFGEYNNEESYEDNEWGYGWFTINTKNEVSSVVCLDYHNNVEVISNIHEDSL